MPVHGWLGLPGKDSWEELGELSNPKSVIDKLGSEGWEIVGNPISQNAVFTYKAASGVWHDRASWIEKDFWFKRTVES